MPPVFEAIEHALDDVAGFVEIGVVLELGFMVLSGRDARDCLGFVQPIAQMISVVATVRDDGAPFGDIGFKTLTCLRNIGPIAGRQAQMDRTATAIANQMQL